MMPMVLNREIKKVLVINLGGIGDVLLSYPALRALRNLYPKANIVFLGIPRTYELAKNLKIFNELVSFQMYEEKSRSFHYGKIAYFLKLLFYLRRKKLDMAINMRTMVSWWSSLKMAFLFFAIGSPLRVGRDTQKRGFFLNIKIPENDSGEKHEMDYDLDTVKALGADISDANFGDILNVDQASVNEILKSEAIKDTDPIIAINPGGMLSRRWPVENFIKIIDSSIKKFKSRIVIIGGLSELELSLKIKQHFNDEVIDLTNKLNILELAALLKKCSLFITNDTGPMHIASVLRTPLVAIFGGGYVGRFDPRRISDKAIVLYKKAECAPCNKIECQSLKCLKEISIEDVEEAAMQLLGIR